MSPNSGPSPGSLDGFLPVSLGSPGVGLACTPLALPIGNLFSSITFGIRQEALVSLWWDFHTRIDAAMDETDTTPLHRLNHRGKFVGLKDPGEDFKCGWIEEHSGDP